MSSKQSLIVPIHLDALCVVCVGKDDSEQRSSYFSPGTADFRTRPFKSQGPNISRDCISKPFSKAGRIEKGVHLHWTLPKALTRATEVGPPERKQIEFPAVPNRWLVTRIAENDGTAAETDCSIKSWVVESDFLSVDAQKYSDSITIPYFDKSRYPEPFRYMGRTVPLHDWEEKADAERFPGLTAIGYGEPSFAAYYPNCRSVFGLHDDPDADNNELKDCKLSYFVMGWYSNDDEDPLHNAQIREEILNTYKWELPEKSTTDDLNQTICSGMVLGVVWNQEARIEKKEIDPRKITAAVGNTATEGLTTLIPRLIDTDKSTTEQAADTAQKSERLLEALQVGHLDKLGRIDAMARLERALHKSTFGSESAGIEWRIERKETHGKPAFTDQGTPPDQPVEKLDPRIAKNIDDLNRAQSEYHRAVDKIESRKSQVFLDWYKYLINKYESESEDYGQQIDGLDIQDMIDAEIEKDKTDLERLKSSIKDYKEDFEKVLDTDHMLKERSESENYGQQIDGLDIRDMIDAEIEKNKTELERLKSSIRDYKKDFEKVLEPDHMLKERVVSRFFKANEPVLLLAGKDLAPSMRYEQNSKLLCRKEDQLISSLTMPLNTGEAITISAGHLPRLSSIPAHLPHVAGKLLAELFFIDPGLSSIVAANSPVGSKDDERTRLLDAIKSEQNSNLPAYYRTRLHGVLPAYIATNEWKKQPWHPIFMHWRVKYRPIKKEEEAKRKSFKPDLISSNFKLSENTIELDQKDLELADFEETYSGIAILTSSAVKSLKDLASQYRNDKISSIFRQLEDVPVLSQTLSGFNDALIMRSQEMQFDVDDPFAQGKSIAFNQRVKDYVGKMNHASPLPNYRFNPIRAGYMRIDQIRIVDAFGRHKDINFNQLKTYATRSLKAKDSKYGDLFLPPRLVQPSRLIFQWLPANGLSETKEVQQGSPICGWLLPNFIDNSLMIFDRHGKSIGSICSVKDNPLIFKNSPGSPSGFHIAADSASLVDEMHKAITGSSHLRSFVRTILTMQNKDSAYFDAFLKTLKNGLQSVELEDVTKDASLTLLAGRPIALARVSLKIDLKGLPVLNQSRNSLLQDMSDGAKTIESRDCAGFTRVDIPVRLGCESTPGNNEYNDGLIGYFKENENKADYTVFYTYHADDESSLIRTPDNKTILLNSEKDNPPLTLTVLMDPRAKLHATPGILPKKRIQIPPEQIDEALNAMEITFLTAPILTDSTSFKLTEQSYKNLEKDGLPQDRLSKLRSLINLSYTTENDFVKAVEKAIEPGQAADYNSDILKRGAIRNVYIPVPDESDYQWSWISRDKDQWREKTVAGIAETTASLPKAQQISEGWLKLGKDNQK